MLAPFRTSAESLGADGIGPEELRDPHEMFFSRGTHEPSHEVRRQLGRLQPTMQRTLRGSRLKASEIPPRRIAINRSRAGRLKSFDRPSARPR